MPVKINPSVVRLSIRDRRLVTFTLSNPMNTLASGFLQFDLPAGLAVEPDKATFGPIQPGASAMVGVTIVSNAPMAGRRIVPYQVVYRGGDKGKEVRTAALPLTVVTDPTLQHVYEYPRPYYLIRSPAYIARVDMSNGLHMFLADDDDVVRLSDSPQSHIIRWQYRGFVRDDGHGVYLASRISSQPHGHHPPRSGALASDLLGRPHPDQDGPGLDAVREKVLLGARQLVIPAGSAALEAHRRIDEFWQGSRRAAGSQSECSCSRAGVSSSEVEPCIQIRARAGSGI